MQMKRASFQRDDLTLSYLDSGGELPAIIALHAHWMEGVTFSALAEALDREWRFIAPDQRGHGYSGHAESYGREDYLGDIEALFRQLGLKDAVLLGNSLGGVNAYQFAARRSERVRALIIEDIGVQISSELPDMRGWDGCFANREELERQIGSRMSPYLQDSIRETQGGLKLAFEPRDMVRSQAAMAGDHWSDWLATDCPALLIRGSESRVTTAEECGRMAA
jgi:esterase